MMLSQNLSECTGVLRREVNVVRYTSADLARRAARGDNDFLRSVAEGPKQWLIGDERVLAELWS